MKKRFQSKHIGLALVASLLLFIVVKAANPYTVTINQLNDSEFPRVQVAMNISGDIDFFSGDIEIEEEGKTNNGPQVLLPKHQAPSKVNLHILVDTSGRVSRQADLIRTNLKALIQYLFDMDMAEAVYTSSIDGTQEFFSNNLQGAINDFDSLSFSEDVTEAIDGFTKIAEEASKTNSTNYQKVLLVVNGSDFKDNRIEGIAGSKMRGAIKSVVNNEYLTFVWGNPIKKLHAARSDDQSSQLDDFVHWVPGGYLGGFGNDLTSLVDLLRMQSENDYVLQYYSTGKPGSFVGSQATLKIDGSSTYDISYSNTPSPDNIIIDHLPENEIVIGEALPLEVDLSGRGSMVNALEMRYRNEAGDFVGAPFIHRRSASEDDLYKYTLDLPEEALWNDEITYYLSVKTPYSSLENWSYTIPVNAYNGIELTATTVKNGAGERQAILWKWTVPREIKAKKYEVWLGEEYLETTSNKFIEIPIGEDGNECDRYQIVQIKVTMPDGSESASRPVGYFAEPDDDGFIIEKDAVNLMIQCIEEKEIDTYTKIRANTPGFDDDANLTLERAGLYLAKIISEDIWQRIEGGPGKDEGRYSMLHYIMIFINRDEYLKYAVEGVPMNESLVYKLISKANHTEDINQAYENALSEIARRIIGSTEF